MKRKTTLITVWKSTHKQLKIEATLRGVPMTQLVDLMVASVKLERESHENRNKN